MSVRSMNIVNNLKKSRDQYKMFDFSNVNKEQKLFSNEFKKIPDYLKIEIPKSFYIDKFVCLRSKRYANTTKLDANDNKITGIGNGYKKEIAFDQYLNCLKNETYNRESKQYCNRSHDHEMYLQQITKKSLSPFDDKREYINKTESRPWGGL